jgi:hypothetical protein
VSLIKCKALLACLILSFLISWSWLSQPSLGALPVSLSDQGTDVKNSTSGEIITLGNLTVEIYDSLAGGGLIYNETFTSAIANGSWNVMLGESAGNPLYLEYGKKYYKDYKINGEDAGFTNLTGDTVPRQFFYSPLGDIAESDMNQSTNLTIGQKITFALGQVVDAITSGWVRITGNTNVTGNLTVPGGRVGIGTMSPDAKLHINRFNENIGLYLDTSGMTSGNEIALYISDWGSGYAGDNYGVYSEGRRNYFSGKVGIGTPSPLNKLTVVGDINATDNITTPKICLNGDCQTGWSSGSITGAGSSGYLTMWNGTTSINSSLIYQSGSNIGIGTANPATKLEVAGDVKISGNGYLYSSSVGNLIQKAANLQALPNTGFDMLDGWVYTVGGSSHNQIVSTTGPNGGQIKAYRVFDDDQSEESVGGRTEGAPFNTNATYRVSVWMRENTTGEAYIGVLTTLPMINMVTGAIDNVPDFLIGNLPSTNEWYRLVAYIYPYGMSNSSVVQGGIYDTSGRRVSTSIKEFRFNSSATINNMSLSLYSALVGVNPYQIFFYDPRIEIASDFENPLFFGNIGTSGNLSVSGIISTPTLCLNGSCQTGWPAGGNGSSGGWANDSQNTYTMLNAGIGTASPSTKLNVNGSFRVDNSSSNAIFIVNTTMKYVGIGTSQPTTTLHVVGDGIRVIDNESSPFIEIGDAAIVGGYGEMQWDSVGDYIKIYTQTAGDNQLVLLESGRIGIGTNVPMSKLTVIGDVNATTNISTPKICLNGDCQTGWPASGASSWQNTTNTTYTSSYVGIGTIDPIEKLDIANGNIRVVTGSISVYSGSVEGATYTQINGNEILGGQGGIGSGGNIKINGGDSGNILLNTISTGNVGIGTASPTNKLTVVGDVNATDNVTTPKICLNGNCQSSWPGGWTNNSVNTSTSLNVVTGGNITLGSILKITPTAAAPSCTDNGLIYVDTSPAFCYCNGTDWLAMAGAGTCA